MTATVNWLMGEGALDPPWEIGPEGERFEVEVTGDPSVKLTFKGLQPETIEEGLVRNPGVVSTANHCVSAIPYVVAAEPGIKTYLDLPLIAGRAAPHLAAPSRDPRPVPARRARSPSSPAAARGSAAASRSRSPRPARTSWSARAPRPTSTRSSRGSRRPGAAGSAWSPTSWSRRTGRGWSTRPWTTFGRLDVLVNNAGGTGPRPAMQTSEGFFERAMRFNVTQPFLMSQLGAQAMVDTAGSGSIVNISSRSADLVLARSRRTPPARPRSTR